jgi:hypothetical protein
MSIQPAIVAGALSFLFLASCTQHQQQGAGIGALGGAAVGALAGDSGGDVVRGAAVGAALGTGVAALTEQQRREAARDDGYYRNSNPYGEAPAETTPSRPAGNSYPVAERTNNPDQVISPFPPYNVIDVAGFRSGQLARDPSNQKIFRIP